MGLKDRINKNITRVFVVQDRSGSMQSIRDSTISGFNEYVQELKKTKDGDIFLSLVQFDTKVDTVLENELIADISDMDHGDFVPGGMTALYDGLGTALSLAEKSTDKDDKVIVVIMTDGLENSSREISKDKALKWIKDKRKEDWEFVFLGAGEESWGMGIALGIPEANNLRYSRQATGQAFRGMAHTHSHYASASSVKGLATTAFDDSFKTQLEEDATMPGHTHNSRQPLTSNS